MSLGDHLHDLREKYGDRALRRKRQVRRFKKTGDIGYKKAAARNGRAMRFLRKAISKTKRAIKRHGGTLDSIRLKSVALGRPHWGGGADIMGQFVAPFLAERFGLAKGSGKRTPQHNAEIGGSSTSDHLTTRIETFARDFPTFAGEAGARALAAAFGWHTWQPNSYATFEVTIAGHRFRIQILWGAGIDHGDHIHVGIELIG